MRHNGRMALGLALAGMLCGSAARAQEETAATGASAVDAALELSRQTGAPILAVAGSET